MSFLANESIATVKIRLYDEPANQNKDTAVIRLAFIVVIYSFCVFSSIIQPNENLVLEGMPDIENVEKAAAYTEFRPNSLASLHPQSSDMLVLTRPKDGASTQLFLLDGVTKALEQITQGKNKVASAMFEPLTGQYIIFSQDTDGNEKNQNYRYDLASKTVTLLTDGHSKNSSGIWSHGTGKLAYTSNLRNGKDMDFYIMDPSHPAENKRIAQFDKGDSWGIHGWSWDNQYLLAEEYLSISETHIWTVNIATGEKTRITPLVAGEKIAYHNAQFSHDNNFVFTITDAGSDFLHLAKINVHTGEQTNLTTDMGWDIEAFELSPHGNQLAVVVNENGVSKVMFMVLDAEQNVVHTSPCESLPLGVISNIQWHDDNETLAFDFSSARIPTDVYTLNSDSLLLERHTQTEANGLNVEQFAEPKLVTWHSFDGLPISGFLYEPPAHFTGKRPVMVMIHGGPEAQSRPTFMGRSNYFLNELGIALFVPNIRGSTGYGKKFLQAPNGFNRVDAYRDIETLLDWLKEQPTLDGDKILIYGGSYGGHMTLATATRYNDKIACSIDVVGMSNLVTFLENTEERRRDLRRAIYGDERDPAMRAFLESIAPLAHAENIKKPLFVIQGKNDPRVPYSEAKQMVDRVKTQGTPVWFLTANDEGHGFAKKPNMDFQFFAMVAFMEQYLLRH